MKCSFFLLFEDYVDAQRGLSQSVRDELERFARNLGHAGAVVLPFPAMPHHAPKCAGQRVVG